MMASADNIPCYIGLSLKEEEECHKTIYTRYVMQLLSCLYDGKWWIGSVFSVSEEYDDCQVKFLHPHGPASTFKWPQREDICWVDKKHILCKIQAPVTKTGRSYQIVNDNLTLINDK
jgi:hypothetical protein